MEWARWVAEGNVREKGPGTVPVAAELELTVAVGAPWDGLLIMLRSRVMKPVFGVPLRPGPVERDERTDGVVLADEPSARCGCW